MTAKESTRELIFSAAFELISEKGLSGTSTREIAKRAGVAEVTIFRHFTNKETLFRQITLRHSIIPDLELVVPTIIDKPIDEGIPILVKTFLKKMSDDKAWIRILQTQILQDPETFQPICQSFLDELYRVCCIYFTEVLRRGTQTCCDPKLAAKVFVILCYGFFQVEEMQLGNSIGNTDNEPIIDAMVRMLSSGVVNRPLSV